MLMEAPMTACSFNCSIGLFSRGGDLGVEFSSFVFFHTLFLALLGKDEEPPGHMGIDLYPLRE
jgi:hypothetical protein